jgi:predicted PurR-regulated permease PerM
MAKLKDKIRTAGTQFALGGLVPEWVLNVGIVSWTVVGAVAVLMIFATFFAMSASITIPLILAMVIGMISYPLVEKMVAKRVPVAGAAVLVLVFLVVVIAFAGWVVVAGVISQWPAIQSQLQAGLESAATYLNAAGFDGNALKTALSSPETASSANTAASGLASSLGSAVASGLSGIFALFFGIFISAMLLFYVLTDFPNIARWIGSHMGLPVDVGLGIVDDAVYALRGYFRATTITGLVVSVTIGVAMLVLGIPLAGAVVIVTFLTCYIPFFGAIISGAFAFLIALGTSGLTQAIIILVIVLIAQNVLQTIINARVMGDSLNLSPLVVLVVTMLGSIFAGLLGAALAAPVTALLISAGKRLSAINFDDFDEDDEDDEPATAPAGA